MIGDIGLGNGTAVRAPLGEIGGNVGKLLDHAWEMIPWNILLVVGMVACVVVIGLGIFLYIMHSRVYWPRAIGMSAMIAGGISALWLGSGFVMSLFYGALAFSYYWASWENALPGIITVGLFLGFFIEHAYFEGESEAGVNV